MYHTGITSEKLRKKITDRELKWSEIPTEQHELYAGAYDAAVRMRPDQARYREFLALSEAAWAAVAAATISGMHRRESRLVLPCSPPTQRHVVDLPGGKKGDMCFWARTDVFDAVMRAWEAVADEQGGRQPIASCPKKTGTDRFGCIPEWLLADAIERANATPAALCSAPSLR